jgi:crotonobetainyl-CoA:carnitine CoA-transferase CaiB-like acyl-CoA transferase
MDAASNGLLKGYRILDLCDEKGLMAGKLLADLGAEVIKVEPPHGESSRRIGPFCGNEPDPEKSLFFFAYNTSKKGITLDIEKSDGQALVKRLVSKCDALLESFSPGYLDRLGLGYDHLVKENPRLIMTSITPFGSTGPYHNYAASDLVLWALSGLLFICGDPDRPPIRISLSQAYLHAGTDGAAGTVMALFHRGNRGICQKVEVSALRAMERVAYTAHTLWDARGKILRRPGSGLRIPPLGTTTPVIWPCKDGSVAYYLFGGQMGAVSNPALTEWMAEEGLASDKMTSMDWPGFDIGRTTQEEMDREIVDPIRTFFGRHSQKELWEEGAKRRVMVYPVNDAEGVLAEGQLQERGFWVRMEHPPLGRTFAYPGAFVRTEKNLCGPRSPAPGIGEHNAVVYGELLGMGEQELSILKKRQII